jgi:hypothetical protein
MLRSKPPNAKSPRTTSRVTRSTWGCRKCNSLRYASERGALVHQDRGALTSLFESLCVVLLGIGTCSADVRVVPGDRIATVVHTPLAFLWPHKGKLEHHCGSVAGDFSWIEAAPQEFERPVREGIPTTEPTEIKIHG